MNRPQEMRQMREEAERNYSELDADDRRCVVRETYSDHLLTAYQRVLVHERYLDHLITFDHRCILKEIQIDQLYFSSACALCRRDTRLNDLEMRRLDPLMLQQEKEFSQLVEVQALLGRLQIKLERVSFIVEFFDVAVRKGDESSVNIPKAALGRQAVILNGLFRSEFLLPWRGRRKDISGLYGAIVALAFAMMLRHV